MLLRLCVIQKDLPLSLFSSFSFSLQQIRTKFAFQISPICLARRVWSNSDTLENIFSKVLLIIIRGECDHYLFNLRKEFITTIHSKAA